MDIQALLSEKIKEAMIATENGNYEPIIRQSAKIKFGHYQANGVITMAKKLKKSPRRLAEKILKHLDLTGIASKTEITESGFINIFLDPVFLSKNINIALKSDDLGVNRPKKQTIVVDYSSPNIAKEMHVGHLRSTIIGDAVVRTLEFLGHRVIRANHIGDWGTQFGMLIAWLDKYQKENSHEITLKDLESFYQDAKKHFDKNKIFAEYARNCVVKLQNGDEYFLKLWRKLVDITISKNQIIYLRLNVTLTSNDIMGESLYRSYLPSIIADLKSKGLAVEHRGATVVFLDEFKNREGKPLGIIIQKKDGGYLYTTTDIACAKYRYEYLHADRILYYTDSRQHQHLMQAWTIARKAHYIPDSVSLEHHMFGMVLGKDGKPFKTRSGNTIKLSYLLDEVIKRARRLIIEKNPYLSLDKLEKLANAIGIGALKYADLSKNRITNYVFDWDKILSFQGNTAPYIQYAYTRILSIFRKANIDENILLDNTQIIFTEDCETCLAIHLIRFEEILNLVAFDGTPHVMCVYLYHLAGLFSRFYEYLPILSAKSEKVRRSRLKLALLTAKTLKVGLNTLGIETVEQM